MQCNLRDDTSYPACLPQVDSSASKTEIFQDQQTITTAVIIAAGNGSRLQGYQRGRPKPLLKVGGIPLLKRVILAAKRSGVQEFVIVLGYQAARIRKTINARELGVRITWVRNTNWPDPNGISVLKAERFVNGRFFLFMSDHVFDPNILKRLQGTSFKDDCSLLCVDYRLNRVPNLDDATKVWTEDDRLTEIGKSLTEFNAIDVGIFICTQDIFDALRQSQLTGDYSLSGGVRVLSRENKMRTFDIHEAYWQDVDTIPDIHHAERLLFRATRSESDGIIAKTINRPISNFITKFLIKTPITPNQLSVFNLVFAAFIAWLVSFGKPINTIVGGILFQLASIIDGCDGEVAKIKLKNSESGAWIDTITDQISYILFIVGITVGSYNASNDPAILVLTGITLTLLIFALRFGLRYVRQKGSGSLRALDQDISKLSHSKHHVALRFFGFFHHLGRRDMFSFVGFLLMLTGNITAFYFTLIGLVNLISSGIIITTTLALSKRREFSFLNSLRRLRTQLSKPSTNGRLNLHQEKEFSD